MIVRRCPLALSALLLVAWGSASVHGQEGAVGARKAEGTNRGMVKQIKVVADKAPDCSSLGSIVETVTRGCKTNDAKAIAKKLLAKMK